MLRRRGQCSANALASIAAAFVCALAPAAARAADADRALRGAYEAFRAGEALRLERYAAALKGHVLEPYVESWRIRLQIENTPDDEVRDFLARHAGAYAAQATRGEWLKALGRRGEWQVFERERRLLLDDDAEVRCYELIARLEAGDPVRIGGIGAAWLAAAPLPEGCVRLANRLAAQGRLEAEELWARVRVLFSSAKLSEAKRTLGYLPRGEAPRDGEFMQAARQPASLLAHLRAKPAARLGTRAAREVAVLALLRLAERDPGEAERYLAGPLGAALAEDEQRYAWGKIGHAAARSHDPRTLRWYALAGDAALDDAARAWMARVALREGDWQAVRRAIDALSKEARQDPTWIYWYARALAAQGQEAAARPLYVSIAQGTGFYNLLAAEELGEAVSLPEPSHEPAEEEIEAASRNPALVRGLNLRRIGLHEEAMREWGYALHGMDDAQLLAAAEFARRVGAYERAISAAIRTTYLHNFSLRYVAPYREAFAEYARSRGLDEAWVLAVVRQESRFATDARSPAGARGLMQVMPATAKWIARQSGMRGYRSERMSDIDTNLTLGTRYLKSLQEQLGHPVLALAAYNAGPNRARRWRDARPLEGAIYAESIPYAETRDYVKKVMASAMFYAMVLHGGATPLKAQLGEVSAAEPAGAHEKAQPAAANARRERRRR